MENQERNKPLTKKDDVPLPLEPLADKWQWFLYVLFGGIGTLAMRRLDEGLWAAGQVSPVQLMHYVSLAVCLFAFLIYDVGALAVLIKKFPYKISGWSAARYFLDIVMVFLLFLLLMSGLGPVPASDIASKLVNVPPQSPLVMICAVSAWHIGAAIWHFLASFDHGHLPAPTAYLPHVLFAGAYWLVYAIGHWVFNLDTTWLLSLIGLTVLAISIFRWFQVIKLHVAAGAE